MNNTISKLPDSKEWSVLFTSKCNVHNYAKYRKYEGDLQKCLDQFDYDNNDFDNDGLIQLNGDYGGIDMDIYFRQTIFNKLIESLLTENDRLIRRYMIDFMNQCYNLFYGLHILSLYDILHLDIKPGNIVGNNRGYRFIDFGLSTNKSNKKFIKNRSISEFKKKRIYYYYPFEFLYLYISSFKIYFESNREYMDNISIIHSIFDRDKGDFREDILKKKNSNNLNEKSILNKLDIYSLGISIIEVLHGSFKEYTYVLLRNPVIEDIYELLMNITNPDADHRLSATEAYIELCSIVNKKPKNVNKRSKKKSKKKSKKNKISKSNSLSKYRL